MNILVVGATGLLGLEVSRRLQAGGHTVAGLVRAASPKQAALRALGVEVRPGDLRDPATLGPACRSVETVVCTATSVVTGGSENSLAQVDGAGLAHLIEAARAQGVKRFVFVSASPNLSEAAPLMRFKRATERTLRASGLEYVILQPCSFMDIWLGPALGWDLQAGTARIFGPGTGPVSYICVADVAAYTAAVAVDRRVANQDIPLGGPEALSPRQALAIIEKAVGKRFKVTAVPGFVPRTAGVVLRPFNPKLASLMTVGGEVVGGDIIDNARARSLADVRLTPLAEWAARAA
jgi:uncharacterized protein YbjT (DUF2867 family)